ncbi:hypothetical protein E2C01_045800 [Portunus trituberculatus]|uniref:Uncharacterized protein n=1 Tax=Portunus trituberculatus TaxID=210409 RepID=A0A5B7FZ87_PORTR|nr:hypothetical protein [Portunus trituberculatus]
MTGPKREGGTRGRCPTRAGLRRGVGRRETREGAQKNEGTQHGKDRKRGREGSTTGQSTLEKAPLTYPISLCLLPDVKYLSRVQPHFSRATLPNPKPPTGPRVRTQR